MVVRQRSSAGIQDPTISTASSDRKKSALIQRLRDSGDKVINRNNRKSVLPVTDYPKEMTERRRAWSDDGLLDSLAAALDGAEEVFDRRTLPLHEALDEVTFDSPARKARACRSVSADARYYRAKEDPGLCLRASLPMHYRLRTTETQKPRASFMSFASKVGFGLGIFMLHAFVCGLLAAVHSWPAARPYLNTAAFEARWAVHRLTGAQSRPVEDVLDDIRFVDDRWAKTMGEIDRINAKVSTKVEAGELSFVVKALEIKAKSELDLLAGLRRELQFISREAVIEQFGEGPHFVQFDLDFRSDSSASDDDGESTRSFVVKMAPLSATPHSVYVFLEQVSQEFWDGRSFLLNPGHLIMATSPLVSNGARPDEAEALEQSHAIAPVFPEYSESYPHLPYTLGFVASKSVPHFYVNTKDNVEIHGPGKQGHHVDANTADPCFGEVVLGMDVVERISEVPTKSGPWLKGKVRIQRARIVPCPLGMCEDNM